MPCTNTEVITRTTVTLVIVVTSQQIAKVTNYVEDMPAETTSLKCNRYRGYKINQLASQ